MVSHTMGTSTDERHLPRGRHSSSQLYRLCQACQSVLTRNDLQVYEWYLHHSSLEAFIEAKRMNCYVCSHLFKSVGSILEDIQEGLRLAAEVKTPDIVVEGETQSTDDGTSDLRADLLQIFRSDPPRGVSFTCLQIYYHSGMPLEIHGCLNPSYEGYFPLNTTTFDGVLSRKWRNLRSALLHAGRLMIVPDQAFTKEFPTALPSNTGSMETWSIVNSWVKTCSQNHDCMAQVNTKWHPTRLVEIMSNETFRIIRSDCISQHSQGYITLSHRWGSSDLIKLTTDNLSNLARPSPVSILPKTFREALVVAQRMNIRFIWIDSLCIIQSGDDGADWQREATEMGNVYVNSFCNISADYGNNRSYGLFFERTPPFKPACMVHLKFNMPESMTDESYPVYPTPLELLELRTGGLCHIVSSDGVEDVSASPLNRRAWVMQERLLAPRVVHFLAGQVSWECAETLAWEKAGCGVGPDGLHIQDYKVLPQMGPYLFACRNMKRVRNDEPDINEIADNYFWADVVGRYSRCGLTNQSDRLVAISGVARRMARNTGDQYVAGLWASSMPGTLGWKREGDPDEGSSRQHSKGYYAPSFSWAASDGVIDNLTTLVGRHTGMRAVFIKHRKKPLYSAILKTGPPKDRDGFLADHVFGPMTSPEVEIRARGILRTCHRVPGQLVSQDEFSRHSFILSKAANDSDSGMQLYSQRGEQIWVSYDRPGDHEDVEADNSTYYFAIIAWRSMLPHPSGHEDSVEGLLLKSTDPSMGRFKRIGHVEGHRGLDADPNFLCFGAPLGNERHLPARWYDEVSGEHLFYIV